jgi:hypothetical protein
MSNKKRFSHRRISPILSLLMDRFNHDEIRGAQETVTTALLNRTLSAIISGFPPRIYAIERPDGVWDLLSGQAFLSAVYQYFTDQVAAPTTSDEHLSAFHGKRFSELHASDKRTLLNTAVELFYCDAPHKDDVQAMAFRAAIRDSQLLNQ